MKKLFIWILAVCLFLTAFTFPIVYAATIKREKEQVKPVEEGCSLRFSYEMICIGPSDIIIKQPTREDLENFEENWHEAAVYMAKTIWGEARGCTREGQENVAWCILNRVDSPDFPNTIIEVITAPGQFHGYSSSFPCTEEFYEMSLDIIARWQLEKLGVESNRTLESDYLFFCADGKGGNSFRKEY